MKNLLMCAGFVLALVGHAGSVIAAPAYSWNLAKDLSAKGNSTNPLPGGIWSLLYDSVGTTHNQANYRVLPLFSSTWYTYPDPLFNWTVENSTNILIGVTTRDGNFTGGGSEFQYKQGDAVVHPSTASAAIVKWTSPIAGKVTVSGVISDFDARCGNGIKWSLDKGNFILMSGVVLNGNNGASFVQQNIPVSIGTPLYFVVNGNGNQDCDTSRLELLISSP